MVGGASQLETVDHKPILKNYAGRLAREIFSKEDLEGLNPEKDYSNTRVVLPVFSFKRYGESDTWDSEVFPNLTKVVDDIAFINSMHTEFGNSLHRPDPHAHGLFQTGPPQSWLVGDLRAGDGEPEHAGIRGDDGRTDGGRALHDAGFLLVSTRPRWRTSSPEIHRCRTSRPRPFQAEASRASSWIWCGS